MAKTTHNQKVLALLEDGRPHTHHELYDLHVIAHSRISDLRRMGHSIRQWRDGDDYFYQLDPPPLAAHVPVETPASAEQLTIA